MSWFVVQKDEPFGQRAGIWKLIVPTAFLNCSLLQSAYSHKLLLHHWWWDYIHKLLQPQARQCFNWWEDRNTNTFLYLKATTRIFYLSVIGDDSFLVLTIGLVDCRCSVYKLSVMRIIALVFCYFLLMQQANFNIVCKVKSKDMWTVHLLKECVCGYVGSCPHAR